MPNFSLRDIGITFDDYGKVAQDIVNTKGWAPYRWSFQDPEPGKIAGCYVTGSIPDGVFRSGPRKGRPRYTAPGATDSRTVFVPRDTVIASARLFEQKGQCWNCKGTGEIWAGWSRETGTRQKICPRCDGTGISPLPAIIETR